MKRTALLLASLSLACGPEGKDGAPEGNTEGAAEAEGAAESSTANGSATSTGSTTATSGSSVTTTATETSSGGSQDGTGTEGPNPSAIQTACEAVCEMEIECNPEVIPNQYESFEDCVTQCVEGIELYYADGCGPAALMRIVCWADLSCEEWLEYVQTGYSPCGDDPMVQWCGD